jgi:hypothetical protein
MPVLVRLLRGQMRSTLARAGALPITWTSAADKLIILLPRIRVDCRRASMLRRSQVLPNQQCPDSPRYQNHSSPDGASLRKSRAVDPIGATSKPTIEIYSISVPAPAPATDAASDPNGAPSPPSAQANGFVHSGLSSSDEGLRTSDHAWVCESPSGQ